MVVAVPVVGMVEVTVDQVVGVVAVLDGFVSAIRSVYVRRVVAVASMIGRAPLGVIRVLSEHVLVYVVAVNMMEVTVIHVVEVSFMMHSGVAAVAPVLVAVSVVSVAGHGLPPPLLRAVSRRGPVQA